ncbi:OprD family outer membrane porin [Acinetobacter baumannii]|uniref:OprD family outer membrane porin n=1 Tax=Acinetobacter baumannii TaxID=470 RepID=UPI003AF6864E
MKYVIYFAGVSAPFILNNFSYASDFIDDAKITVTARNYYLDRNYVEEAPYPAARDWAQGFILKAQSGYTAGDVGVGLDFMANAGFRFAQSVVR